jgi:hypothetical protein
VRLVAKLNGQPGRHAVVDFLEHLPPTEDAARWQQTLLGCLEGLGTQAGRETTVSELAAACTDYLAAAPPKWGLVHFRSFVDRVVAKRFRSPHQSKDQKPDPADVGARWLASKGIKP